MTLLEIIQDALNKDLTSGDRRIELELLPGLTEDEIARFETTLPCPIPQDVRELLSFCRGFFGSAADMVDFVGLASGVAPEAVFPYGLPIAGDGFGNFWVVDLLPESTNWGPIYFVSHDPPVILYQSPSLEHFLSELFKLHIPPHQSALDDVHEDRLFRVWQYNPGLLSYGACLDSPDPTLAEFAGQLDSSFHIVDLREPQIGFGFSWGRYGPETLIKRFGMLPIFAYQKEQLLRRLFGQTYE